MEEVKRGDFILVRGTGFYDKLIQFGQSLRFTTKYAYFNHAALIISDSGDLIEAINTGVKQTHISKYAKSDYKIIHVEATEQDRDEAIAFARSCINDGYGWTTIVSTAVCLLFGLKFSFGFNGEDICSGLVARSLERTNAIFPGDPSHMTPAHLCKYYL